MAYGKRPWNSNIHYHDVILRAVPADCPRVLDVGCGDGLLTAELCRRGAREVVGLDVSDAVLERARRRHSDRAIRWLNADLFDPALDAGGFDAVVSVAALHHMDAERGLRRLAELTRPGGVVALIGLAANDWWDWPAAALGVAVREAYCLRFGRWVHSAPMCWPPPRTYRQMRRLAGQVLPGSEYRRHLLQRFSVVWRKPR